VKKYIEKLAAFNNDSIPPSLKKTSLINTFEKNHLTGSETAQKSEYIKFVLLTNVRLDFIIDDATYPDSVTESKDKFKDDLHKNFKESAKLSLKFAHCINPFKTTIPPYYNKCENTLMPSPSNVTIPVEARRDSTTNSLSKLATSPMPIGKRGGGGLTTITDIEYTVVQDFSFAALAMIVFAVAMYATEKTKEKQLIPSYDAAVAGTFFFLYTVIFASFAIAGGLSVRVVATHFTSFLALAFILYWPWRISKSKNIFAYLLISLFFSIVWSLL
jgi:hypothetical protein